MEALAIFTRQILSRSSDHRRAMQLLATAKISSQMMAILRQELDSMVRVVYLLNQGPSRRASLIEASVNGQLWTQPGGRGRVTDREMVELAQHLQGWTRSVYTFGCAFIHLTNLHDYNDRDPMVLLPAEERDAILAHCRYYHGGPENSTFEDLLAYLPSVLEKVSGNLKCYLEQLHDEDSIGQVG
ncbi:MULTISPECIES: hypothetical protein [Pseudomonas]|jgi:hypothetical protein|uniref:Uncharacterized protein n=2 Tax=Pseudomonas fluorescens group TaxID=136843 RepID=A0A024EKZ8_9PSED|nr:MULTISPECIES: hypothetical protein [Pseudomonas]NMY74683.1 hypothetical protein [Pseudomonas sp. WS 5071]AHZ73589.1 hypothetical protein OU5_P0337 [Pseudomonas mandelii JR-1]MBI6565175.1 hypothetical protein [Pseudomonas synxantha]MBI6579889.1 hypothetical protein [Pseudomonas synxantha]MBI6646699.1 hypothetical protein [Pseudomonas synxantha]